ncbi:MAG: MFS transporter [Ktedonobacterales bacterium]
MKHGRRINGSAHPKLLGRALGSSFSAFSHRNYRLYWLGQLISSFGTWMQSIGQVWLVLQLTHSALQIGLVVAIQSLPILIFSLFGGVFADLWPKRQVLFLTQALSAAQALALFGLVATHSAALWQLYLLALLLGVTNCVYRPTSQAFLVELVGRDDLTRAIALDSSIATLGRIVGPSLGGLLIAAGGVAPLFLLNGISYLAVLVALLLMDPRQLYAQANLQREGWHDTIWQRVGEGLGYVWRTPAIMVVIVIVGLVLLFGSNFSVVLPLFSTQVLGAGARGFGFLFAAFGVGALVATLGMAARNPTPTVRQVLLGSLGFSILVMAFGLAHAYPAALVLITAVGGAETLITDLAVTMVQRLAPDHLRGRAGSVYVLFFGGLVPPGYILTGWLAGTYGVSATLVLCASICLLITGAGWLWWRTAATSPDKAMLDAGSPVSHRDTGPTSLDQER